VERWSTGFTDDACDAEPDHVPSHHTDADTHELYRLVDRHDFISAE
jgi:hypothetical protein